MGGMRECSLGFWGISWRILENVIILTFRGMFQRIPGECWRRFRGMFGKIPGNVRRDSRECSKRFWECSRGFRRMLKKIPWNVSKDSQECWQRFSRMLKKIERFIMQLNENTIKGYILKYNQKCAQKFMKTSHVDEHV